MPRARTEAARRAGRPRSGPASGASTAAAREERVVSSTAHCGRAGGGGIKRWGTLRPWYFGGSAHKAGGSILCGILEKKKFAMAGGDARRLGFALPLTEKAAGGAGLERKRLNL